MYIITLGILNQKKNWLSEVNAGLIAFYKTALGNTEMWSYAVWTTKQNNDWNGFQTKRESVMAANANELDNTRPSLTQNNDVENT